MTDSDVLWCGVCGDAWAESRIDLLRHLNEDHTLSERLETLIETGQRPEVADAEL